MQDTDQQLISSMWIVDCSLTKHSCRKSPFHMSQNDWAYEIWTAPINSPLKVVYVRSQQFLSRINNQMMQVRPVAIIEYQQQLADLCGL